MEYANSPSSEGCLPSSCPRTPSVNIPPVVTCIVTCKELQYTHNINININIGYIYNSARLYILFESDSRLVHLGRVRYIESQLLLSRVYCTIAIIYYCDRFSVITN